MERRLAAILVADVVGYGRLMETDEAGTLAILKSRRQQLLQPLVSQHQGRVVKLMGDGVLVEFASAVNAVECAVALQSAMGTANDGIPENRRITLRIGVNLGDVMVEGSDLYGDGVNIAARLQSLALPGAICISGKVHDEVQNKLNMTFEDLGEREVKNISKPLRVFQLLMGSLPVVEAPVRSVPTSRPSIAVLPFTNMSGGPEQDYFSDGITEDIITELSRFRSLYVIARNSSFQFRGKAVDMKRVGRELGAQYVVEGSVRRAGDRIRVTAQLIDAATGNHLWAERYDRDLKDIFAVQDEMTRTIAATAAGRIESAGTALAKRKSTTHLAAYDLVLRAHETLNRAYSDTDFLKQGALSSARELLKRAIQIDPEYARAYSELARSYMFEWIYAGKITDLDKFFSSAQTAARFDPEDSLSLRLLGMAHLFHRRYDEAQYYIERALVSNPNDLMAVHNMAVYLDFIGKPSESIEWSKKAMLLDPHHTDNNEMVGVSLYSLGQYEEALIEFRRLNEQTMQRHEFLAATYAKLDRLDEARAEAASVALNGETHLNGIRAIFELYKHPADRDRWLDAMRKAGIPV